LCFWWAVARPWFLYAEHRCRSPMALCIPYSAASQAAKVPTRHKFERYTELDNAKSLWNAARHSRDRENCPEQVGLRVGGSAFGDMASAWWGSTSWGHQTRPIRPLCAGPAKVRAPQWLECGIVLIVLVRLAGFMGRATMRLG